MSPAASREAYGTALLDTGGWVDPFLVPGQIRESLRARGGLTLALPPSSPVGAEAGAAVATSSKPEPARTGYPLTLVPFTPALVNQTGNPNQPGLFELLGQPDSIPWRAWAELSPQTARTLSIEAGSRIRIASAHGSLEAVAVVAEGMAPETVALAFVPAAPGAGRWARWIKEDARRLWVNGDFGGRCAVRVTRA